MAQSLNVMADILPTEIELNIVSPDRMVVHDSVTALTMPGKGGYLGVLPGHAPLLSGTRARRT